MSTSSSSPSSKRHFKVVLLGEGRVGKTSILLRYTKNSYTDKQSSTLQASYVNKTFENATLSIWDTAGQERFHALGPIYYRDADGAVIVYDITDSSSFEKCKVWAKELRKMVGDERKICVCVVGNKMDLMRKGRVGGGMGEDPVRVEEGMARDYTENVVGGKFFGCSAKTGVGVAEIFEDLSLRMVERANKHVGRENRTSVLSNATRQKLIILTPEEEEKASNSNQKRCCSY